MAEDSLTCAGLLFDMDGVLADSFGSVTRSWRRWATEYGIPPTEALNIPHGTRAIDIIRLLRPDLDDDGAAVGLRRIDVIEVDDLEGVVAIPGAAKLLATLPPERWTIVTSARRKLLVARMQAAGLMLPPRTITGDDVTLGKPHPEPYLAGAAVLGFAPASCVVAEDAPSGVKAGKAAGCRVLGVVTSHTATQLYAAGADWVVPTLADVSATPGADGLALRLSNVQRET